MRKRNPWTEEQKNKLKEVVLKNTVHNRIQWTEVQKQIPEKTANQCKTQYILRILDKPSRESNLRWSVEDISRLILVVTVYGKKWKFIQQQYFPQIEMQKLRSKFLQVIETKKRVELFLRNIQTVDPRSVKINRIQNLKLFLQNFHDKFQKYFQNTSLLFSDIDPLEAAYLQQKQNIYSINQLQLYLDKIKTFLDQDDKAQINDIEKV